MPYTLLAGGYRSAIARLSFDGNNLTLLSDSPTPKNPSWVEGFSSDRAFAISESEGLALSLDVRGEVKVTSQVETHGNPAHGECLGASCVVEVRWERGLGRDELGCSAPRAHAARVAHEGQGDGPEH